MLTVLIEYLSAFCKDLLTVLIEYLIGCVFDIVHGNSFSANCVGQNIMVYTLLFCYSVEQKLLGDTVS